jgi:hypothetical protein
MEIPDLFSKNFKRLGKRKARGDVRIHEKYDKIWRGENPLPSTTYGIRMSGPE